MYVCMVITYSRVWINRVRLPILLWSAEQGKLIFPCPRACLRIWSRETGSAVPSRVSLLISVLRLNMYVMVVRMIVWLRCGAARAGRGRKEQDCFSPPGGFTVGCCRTDSRRRGRSSAKHKHPPHTTLLLLPSPRSRYASCVSCVPSRADLGLIYEWFYDFSRQLNVSFRCKIKLLFVTAA